jgi:hypothetical protein
MFFFGDVIVSGLKEKDCKTIMMSTESNHAKGAHVVAFPLPLGGHHARFAPFIKILARNGLTITVITTMHYIDKTQHALMENNFEACDNIRVIGLPTENEEVKVDNAQVVRGIEHLKNPLRDLMKQLMESNGVTNGESQDSHFYDPPVCLISDFCIPWIQVHQCNIWLFKFPLHVDNVI